MLMFLATLSASVAASLLVEAVDIEGIKSTKRRLARTVNASAKSEASFPCGAVGGVLQ
jgi:hypothetical protein